MMLISFIVVTQNGIYYFFILPNDFDLRVIDLYQLFIIHSWDALLLHGSIDTVLISQSSLFLLDAALALVGCIVLVVIQTQVRKVIELELEVDTWLKV